MTRPKMLDLYAGEGGAGVGYHQAGFDVTSVDTSKARLAHNPYEAICDDAITYLLAHGHEYDAIHASPPCTGYTRGTVAVPDRLTRYDRLIAATREALLIVDRPFVIENVEDAAPELQTPMTLCGTMFGLTATDDDGTPLWMRRHRLFESNVFLTPPGPCRHPRDMQCAGAYGGARTDKAEARNIRHGGYTPSPSVQADLLGIDWMTPVGLRLSLPPVYTEHLGAQLLDHLARVAA